MTILKVKPPKSFDCVITSIDQTGRYLLDIYTHSSGRRLDIDKNICIDTYISTTYERVGEKAYKHSRNWWYDHTTHWDLECHLHT